MWKKLKVEELRSELAQSGLSTAGTKPTLLQRLEAAIEEETKKSVDSVSKKRRREDEDGYTNGSEKIKAIDKFKEMGIRQLREEAARLGLSISGSKTELLERLCTSSQNDSVVIIAAAKEEIKTLINPIDDSISQKETGDVNGDTNGSQKIQSVDKFREMGVRELRIEAARFGLSTIGTKKELLQRLCNHSENDVIEAAKEEIKTLINPIDDSISQKETGYVNGDTNGSQKIQSVDKFREMGVRELRVEAARFGLSTIGTKKELLQRLCNHSENDVIEAAKQEEISEKEKMVTATKKGAAVLDQWLPDHIKNEFHVLQQGDDIYDAMLNQTNVGDNNNKFYVIQALESDDGCRFMVYNRWGRVGVKGQDKLQGPYTSRESAVEEFELKFFAKTKNHWSNRKEFISHAKSYTWLEMDYTEKEEESIAQGTKSTSMAVQIRETKLEPRIAKFISLICNVSMMKQQMMEIGYNADKLPLGKLSKSTILKGYDVLKRIANVIGRSDRKNLEQLSGEFYTTIPHDFGFKKMREFVIDTHQKLKSKLEMVEALGEIEVATKLLKVDIQMQEDPMYSHYKRLHCELMPLEPDSEEFSMIATYTKNTHAKTHLNYSVDIVQILKVSREGETERFNKFSNAKNRMLLWHGSRLTNWTGILSQGLRIAPREAPATGYMFGKGVYFADMFSKSANYCYSSPSCAAGVLLLCEVALGDMAELLTAKYDADKLPAGKLSTKGVGATAPDLSEARVLDDGIVVPLGKPKEQRDSKGALLYNEYIVYNVDQIRMRYIVQVNFNYKR